MPGAAVSAGTRQPHVLGHGARSSARHRLLPGSCERHPCHHGDRATTSRTAVEFAISAPSVAVIGMSVARSAANARYPQNRVRAAPRAASRWAGVSSQDPVQLGPHHGSASAVRRLRVGGCGRWGACRGVCWAALGLLLGSRWRSDRPPPGGCAATLAGGSPQRVGRNELGWGESGGDAAGQQLRGQGAERDFPRTVTAGDEDPR